MIWHVAWWWAVALWALRFPGELRVSSRMATPAAGYLFDVFHLACAAAVAYLARTALP